VHGNVYKIPNLSQEKVDDLADIFLIDTSIDKLSKSQQAQARNVTRSIFVVQQDNVEVKMNFVNNVDVSPDESGGAIDAVSQTEEIRNTEPVTDHVPEGRFAKHHHAIQHNSGGRL
jgi:hypothetical protein